jgi:tRNA pseudouridine(38-40) synthase
MSKRITHVLKVEYDGTNYSGWQRQKNGLSIQHAIEQALYRLTGHEIQLISRQPMKYSLFQNLK